MNDGLFDAVDAAHRALDEALGMPTVLIVANWRRAMAVNLDDEAARIAISALMEAAEAAEDRALGLVLIGEGGTPGFADAVRRTLAGLEIQLTTLIPYRARGAFATLAALGQPIILGPAGGVGACDTGRLGPVHTTATHDLLAHTPGADPLPLELPPDQRAEPQRRAYATRQAALYRQALTSALHDRFPNRQDLHATVQALSATTLGDQLALDARQLTALGLQATTAPGPLASTLWRLYTACELALELRRPPAPRYTASELFDEVEFEPAYHKPAALIQTTTSRHVHELDTGSPDPDTTLFHGEWL